MFAHDAGNMIVDHDHLVGMAEPLLGKHAHGSGAAADAHARLLLAIDNWRLTGLHHKGRAVIDSKLHRLAIAHGQERLAGNRSLAFRAAGKVAHAAERQHLRAIFRRRHMADRLALATHRGFLRP